MMQIYVYKHNSWRKIERLENGRSVRDREIGEEEDIRGVGEKKKKKKKKNQRRGVGEREKSN